MCLFDYLPLLVVCRPGEKQASLLFSEFDPFLLLGVVAFLFGVEGLEELEEAITVWFWSVRS